MGFTSLLMKWYEGNKRNLPWRGSRDPYLIWVSEVILQQTRMAQGVDYFLSFTEAFPSLEALAAASEDEVLRQWQGLGYYSRARNLHGAAQYILHELDGRFPGTSREWMKLQGVGPYTAAAISSMALGEDVPAMDGNAYRVLSRVFAVDHPIESAAGKKYFRELAADLLPGGRAGEFNQAVMDFGSLVCKPPGPLCSQCVMQDICEARLRGETGRYPVTRPKKAKKLRYFHYFYFHWEDAGGQCLFFVQKRKGGDIWQNMYEFPLLESPEPIRDHEVFRQPGWQNVFGLDAWTLTGQPVEIRHTLTHRIIVARFHPIRVSGDLRKSLSGTYQLVSERSFHKLAKPRLIERFMESSFVSSLCDQKRTAAHF